MKLLKKILAVVMSAVVAVTAMSVTVAAESSLTLGKAVKGEIGSWGGTVEHTINIKTSGTIKITYSIAASKSAFSLSDDGGEELKIKTASVGDGCEILEGGKGSTYLKGY